MFSEFDLFYNHVHQVLVQSHNSGEIYGISAEYVRNCVWQKSLSVVSAVLSQEEGSGFKSDLGRVFMCLVCSGALVFLTIKTCIKHVCEVNSTVSAHDHGTGSQLELVTMCCTVAAHCSLCRMG